MIHVALVRAINVGGHNKVGMADLRGVLTELGFGDVRSLLQSGNLVFDTRARRGDRLESMLEKAAQTTLGLDARFFVRSAREWKAIIARNPFQREAQRDPKQLAVVFLKRVPDRKSVQDLRRWIPGRETIEVKGREAYIVYPDGMGRSRLTNAVIEKRLETRSTGRSWNTVLKLGALAGG